MSDVYELTDLSHDIVRGNLTATFKEMEYHNPRELTLSIAPDGMLMGKPRSKVWLQGLPEGEMTGEADPDNTFLTKEDFIVTFKDERTKQKVEVIHGFQSEQMVFRIQ